MEIRVDARIFSIGFGAVNRRTQYYISRGESEIHCEYTGNSFPYEVLEREIEFEEPRKRYKSGRGP